MNRYSTFVIEAMSAVLKTKIRKLPKTDSCALYSYAHVTNQTLEQAWPALEPYFGKKNKLNGRGMNLLTLITLLRKAGYEVDVDNRYSNTEGVKDRTWGSIKDDIIKEKKPFLVMVLGHIIGIARGEIVDTGRTPDNDKIMVSMSVYKKPQKKVLRRK